MARYALPPRQKMINLLYILLIAMLAINTTSEAQKREEERQKQLLLLAESKEKWAKQLEEEIARYKEKEKMRPTTEDTTDLSERTLLVNDRAMELTTNGQLENPVVIVASSLSNQLFSGFQNPLAVTTIGIKAHDLHMEMQNGKVERKGTEWVAIPNANVHEVQLKIAYQKGGSTRQIGEYKFNVKPLPAPTPYIHTVGGMYKGNVPIRKSTLLTAKEVGASIIDPNIECKVQSFETILIKENGKQLLTSHADGNQFTAEQKQQIGLLEEGDSFYITSIMVATLDGKKRQTPPINVVIIK